MLHLSIWIWNASNTVTHKNTVLICLWCSPLTDCISVKRHSWSLKSKPAEGDVKNSREERAEYQIHPGLRLGAFLSTESHSSLARTVEERSLTGALAKSQTSSFICLTLLHNCSLFCVPRLSTFPLSFSVMRLLSLSLKKTGCLTKGPLRCQIHASRSAIQRRSWVKEIYLSVLVCDAETERSPVWGVV